MCINCHEKQINKYIYISCGNQVININYKKIYYSDIILIIYYYNIMLIINYIFF